MDNPEVTVTHSHESNTVEVGVARMRSTMKDKAHLSREKPSQILAAQLAKATDAVKAELGNVDNVKRCIRNTQRAHLPKEPKTIDDFALDGEWTKTKGGQQFLIHDSGSEVEKRVIVYASDEGLRHLATNSSWYMDGNFKMITKIFK